MVVGSAGCYFVDRMDEITTVDLARSLAANLRQARERRGLSQAGLAAQCGVPRSTIASIESGSSNPTLSVLARLSAALQLSLEELLNPAHAAVQLFRKGELPIHSSGRAGSVIVSKLLPDPIPGMEIDRMLLQPGAHKKGTPHRARTREYLYCEAGEMTVWIEGDRFDLSAGDVVAFPGDTRHSYRCEAAARQVAVAFSVVVLAPVASRAGAHASAL